jgi:hypothetical protein
VSLPTGFTVIAKKKNTDPADLIVIENKRTHRFVIAYRKRSDNDITQISDYDFSTVKKIKERVKQMEERDRKYDEAIAVADKFYNEQNYENAKIYYTTALGLLDKPWPKEQIAKITKLLKKAKRKRS